jgi:hypothetical protein
MMKRTPRSATSGIFDMVDTPTRKYIFVVGSGRCGTTALARILSGHADIAYTPELKYFSYAMAGRKAFEPFSQRSLERFCRRAVDKIIKFNDDLEPRRTEVESDFVRFVLSGEWQGKSSEWIYRSVFDRLIDLFRDKDSVHVVLHTPGDLFHLDQIGRILGKVKVIGMIRDPRNFFASAMKGAKRWTVRDESAIALWNLSARTLRRLAETRPDDFLLVKQEELLLEPERVLNRIGGYLTLDLRELAVTEKWDVNTNFSAGSSKQDILSRYSSSLSEDEENKVLFLCRKEMRPFGYQNSNVEGVGFLQKMKWRLAYASPAFLLQFQTFLRRQGRIAIYFFLKKTKKNGFGERNRRYSE